MKTDLHLHSCLSPCGSDFMDPYDLVGMARVCGLELIALTDHNSAKNCPAAAEAARRYGVGFIPGIEVNTSEDIHCVCYFPTLEAAMAFDAMLEEHLPFIPNRADVFGEQKIIHTDGRPEIERNLLLTGCDISIMDLPQIAAEYGGLCWPAHVDRDANGLFAVLGAWPEDLCVPAAEIREYRPDGLPEGLKIIQASDSHDLESLSEAGGFELPLESGDFAGLYKYIMDKEFERKE